MTAWTPLLPSTLRARIALLLVLSMGFALRLLISPRAPIHANNHGIHEIRVILVNALSATGKSGPYGDTYFVIMNTVAALAGRSDHALFLLNIVLGAITPLGLFLLARALSFSQEAALLSALLLCLSPAHVWLSGTESQMVMHLCLAMFGLSLLLAGLERSRPGLLWSATLLLTLASALHVITIMLALVSILFVVFGSMASVRKASRGFARQAALCLLAGAAYLLFHALSLDKGMLGKAGSRFDSAFTLSSNILWDPTLTPALLAPLALIGFLAAWRYRPRLALLLSLVSLAIIPISFKICACRTDAIRYQTPTQWVYYLLAAFPFSGLMPWPGFLRRKTLLLAAVIAAAICAAPGLILLHAGDEEIQEYRFMRRAARDIPQGAGIRLPASDPGNLLWTDFPDYIGGHALYRGTAPEAVAGGGFIYLGLDCYRRVNMETWPGLGTELRPECRQVCKKKLIPVMAAELDAVPSRWGYQRRFWALSAERPVIGIYRCGP